ncbi:MAG: ABC transporter ATP-binding protein [Motilibacteraceae bacterium]
MSVGAAEQGRGQVDVTGLRHRYDGDFWALHDIDLELTPGVTALVGVNGAGKSTLMSVLAGALRPTAGTVHVDGRDLYGRGRREVLPRVALMPQTLELPGSLTALEAVTTIGWMRGLPGRTARADAQAALETVDLSARAGERVRALSGGMRRRVALAQALVAAPDVLLLDEPSTGLDPLQRRRMVEVVQTLGGTVLLSSHVMEDVVDAADRVVVLHEGQVRFDGPVPELQDLAPAGTAEGRRAEAGFLAVIADEVPAR